MPQFGFPVPRRYNTLRLLGYDYNSTWQLCAISLVTDLRRPVFADVNLAKSVLKALLSDQMLDHMRLCAFTLMPNHLHFLAGVRESENKLPNVIGFFKSYTTQQYWRRGREIVEAGEVASVSNLVNKNAIDICFDGLARHVETGDCGIKELAKREA
jgi:REP element-mobilizing transposase RayT